MVGSRLLKGVYLSILRTYAQIKAIERVKLQHIPDEFDTGRAESEVFKIIEKDGVCSAQNLESFSSLINRTFLSAMEEEEIRLFFLLFQARFTALEVIILAKELADMAVWTGARKIASATRSLLCGLAAHRSLMLPPPPSSPAQPPRTKWTMRVPREPALIMLRNNVGAVFIILFLNWFFPIYPRVKIFLIPASWLGTFHIIGGLGIIILYSTTLLKRACQELGLLSVVFGFNILVALISLRYPRPPYPALKTPAKPPALTTPVKRPIKDLGTSFVRYQVVSST